MKILNALLILKKKMTHKEFEVNIYLDVFGSLSRLTTLSRTVLTLWVGFHLSQGSSPDWGSSTGGCRIDIHRSPF